MVGAKEGDLMGVVLGDNVWLLVSVGLEESEGAKDGDIDFVGLEDGFIDSDGLDEVVGLKDGLLVGAIDRLVVGIPVGLTI